MKSKDKRGLIIVLGIIIMVLSLETIKDILPKILGVLVSIYFIYKSGALK